MKKTTSLPRIVLILLFLTSNLISGQTAELAPYLTKTSPKEVGMISDSLDLIKEHIQWAINGEYIAGGVAIVSKDNQIVYQKAVGFSDRKKTKPLKVDDIFRMASMTKTITTMAIMQLYEDGKLKVTDPVSMYIPEFADSKVVEKFDAETKEYTSKPVKSELTIHHLLTHTSGIPYYSGHPVAGPIYAPHAIVEGWTKNPVVLKDNIAKIGSVPLMHEPGTKYTYGLSTDILGRIVEVISKKSLDDYFKENIFSPLEMNDTYFYLPDSHKNRLVDLWITEGLDISVFPDWAREDFPINGAKTYFSGGGGLSSTAMDYLKFANTILNKGSSNQRKLLEEKTVAMMMQNQIDTVTGPDGAKFGYGGSVYIKDSNNGIKAGRFGWGGFFQTIYWVDPERNIVAILLTNARNTPKWGELFNRFEEIVNNSVLEN